MSARLILKQVSEDFLDEITWPLALSFYFFMLFLFAVALFALAAIMYFGVGWWSSESNDDTLTTTAQDSSPTVRLDGEVMMMSHDGLHHPVSSLVTATCGRTFLGSTTVDEDNNFTMMIPADTRGEIEVSLGLHGGSVSLVTADGTDLHAVVIYNPVNNFFA